MAESDFVIGSKSKIREGDVGANRPNSEAINQKIAGAVNSLIDSTFYQLDFEQVGYFSNSDLFRGAPFRVENTSDITHYQLGILDSGSSGNNTVNVAIYDDTGAFVNNLFGLTTDRLLISGNSGSNIVVGRDVANSTEFDSNTTGHTFQYGSLNLTTIPAGYTLVPYVESFSTSARSIRLTVRLRSNRMVFLDYKVVSTSLSGSNTSATRTIYTTEYPCLLFLEIRSGNVPGFEGDPNCYFDITYTGDTSVPIRTYIWGKTNDSGHILPGTQVAYCPRSNVNVVFDADDDDYSGTVRLHVMRLPDSP